MQVQLGGEMTYFKQTGDQRLEGKLEKLSLETRSPRSLGSPSEGLGMGGGVHEDTQVCFSAELPVQGTDSEPT